MSRAMEIIIAPEECKGCGRCVVNCPRQVFALGRTLNGRGNVFVEVVKPESCIGCRFCYYSCPEPGAITLVEKRDEEKVS